MMVEKSEGSEGVKEATRDLHSPFQLCKSLVTWRDAQICVTLVVLCVTLDNPFFLNLKIDGGEMLPKVVLRIDNLNVKR